jgi:cysteine synthase B
MHAHDEIPQAVHPTAVAAAVGDTPLVRLRSLEPRPGVEVYAKTEWTNPGGSVKDRAALRMIRDGEARGLLRPGKTILDASSGNTGIAYALLGRELGYSVEIVLPGNAGPSRRDLLARYGARVVDTEASEGMDGAIAEARRRHAEDRGRYFYPDQYSNPENWRAHYFGTGPEILAGTPGRITHFVAGLGTSGTFVGVSRRLREADPAIRLISMQPDSPLHALEGLKHMPTAHVPAIYDPTLADANLEISTEEAQTAFRRLAADEGLEVGPSSAAAAAAVRRVTRTLGEGVVVTVFPDGPDKYADDPRWRAS